MRPLALYIHVPYCLIKCPYCDFHSVKVPRSEIPEEDYAQALVAQIQHEKGRHLLEGRPLISVFFGGGTPSLMGTKFFEAVLHACAREFCFLPGIEITVETNPSFAQGKTETPDFKAWIGLGINRVSFGVQSFQDRLLKKLGRDHDANAAIKAIGEAGKAGFGNVSADLMFGIEGQRLSDLRKDLRRAIRLGLKHLSVYQLTVEPNTPLFYRGQTGDFQPPSETLLEKMHKEVPALLEAEGLSRYEISNYAKPGLESRHNLQYWRYEDFLGVGSGAVSFINGRRWRVTRKLKNYLARVWEEEDVELIDAKTALKEKWMMGLRLKEGVSKGSDKERLSPALAHWKEKGGLCEENKKIRLTPYGFLWYNRVVRDLFECIESN